jgi:hypothetical protein
MQKTRNHSTVIYYCDDVNFHHSPSFKYIYCTYVQRDNHKISHDRNFYSHMNNKKKMKKNVFYCSSGERKKRGKKIVQQLFFFHRKLSRMTCRLESCLHWCDVSVWWVNVDSRSGHLSACQVENVKQTLWSFTFKNCVESKVTWGKE